MSAEPWQWGELFEIDVPESLTVRDLGDMIELRMREGDGPILMSAFAPVPGPPERAAADALTRFAATRGLSRVNAELGVQLSRDPDGVIAGRLAFVNDLCWEVYALAWPAPPGEGAPTSPTTLVLAFCAAPTQDDAIFDAAGALLSTVRPLELLVPAADRLEPDPSGDF
jgi:hypothetical protein